MNTKDPISDEARALWLRKNGYSPDPAFPQNRSNELVQRLPKMSPTEFVDTCIENWWCPAYWRVPLSRIEQAEAKHNGLFFVGPGDRERIDKCMKGKI